VLSLELEEEELFSLEEEVMELLVGDDCSENGAVLVDPHRRGCGGGGGDDGVDNGVRKIENKFLRLNLSDRLFCALLSSVVILDDDVAVADEFWCVSGGVVVADKQEPLLLLDWVADDWKESAAVALAGSMVGGILSGWSGKKYPSGIASQVVLVGEDVRSSRCCCCCCCSCCCSWGVCFRSS